MGVLLDSSFLVDLLRSQPGAQRLLEKLESSSEVLLLATPVVYELLSGVRHRGSRPELAKVEAVLREHPSVEFDLASARRAAEVRAELYRAGRPAGVVDVMLAGIAMAHGHTIASRNVGFEEISELFGFRLISY